MTPERSRSLRPKDAYDLTRLVAHRGRDGVPPRAPLAASLSRTPVPARRAKPACAQAFGAETDGDHADDQLPPASRSCNRALNVSISVEKTRMKDLPRLCRFGGKQVT